MLGDIANVCRRRGDMSSALRLQRQALATKAASGNRRQVALSLEHIGQVHAELGDGRRAAQFLGAASAIRDALGAPQPLPERQDTERCVAAVRAALGASAWSAAFETGCGWSQEQAIAEALAEGTHPV